jgi:hypothetical protein
MNLTARLATVGVATVLAAGTAQAVAGPAQASTIYGCGDEQVCWYRGGNYNSGRGPDHRVNVSWLRTHPEGVRMTYWRNSDGTTMDNRLTCVVNNSRAGTRYTRLRFSQYLGGGGMQWTVEAGGYALCYSGTRFDDKASRVTPY